MEPSSKKVRIEESVMDKAKLKPNQVTTTSNIFGPMTTSDASDDDATLEAEDDEFDVSYDVDESDGQDEDEDEDDDDDEAEDDEEDEEEEEEEENSQPGKKRKRNDPADFSLAMQKILSSGLTLSNRQNPILARSIESKKLDEAAMEERIEAKVRHQMTLEKRQRLDKGHNAAVLGDTDAEIARTIERERGMRKVAQRGVVRLFNAIRAAQTAAVDTDGHGTRDERTGLSVRQGAGVKKREAKAQESSKSSFLEMIKAGGSGRKQAV